MTTRDHENRRLGDGSRSDAQECAWVRDHLPLRGLGALRVQDVEVLEAHLDRCAECGVEASLVETLQRCAPEPPDSIRRGVLDTFEKRGSAATPPVRDWLLRAAAVLALALGIGLIWGQDRGSDAVWALALEPEPPAWYGSEWVVAGQPVPEALPDDVLRGLIEEIEQ